MGEHDHYKLTARYLAGDESVINDVLRAYGPKVAGWLQRQYGTMLRYQEIEDILADAIEKLWKLRATYDPSRKTLRGYFLMIAQGKASDLVGSKSFQSSRMERPMGEKIDQVVDTTGQTLKDTGSETPATPSAMIVALRACFQKLNKNQQHILMADANSQDGVAPSHTLAVELHISEESVRVERHRGKQQLRKAMGEMGYRS